MAPDEKNMYEPYQSYELAPAKTKRLKNVFVTFSGFCMNRRGLIKECHHDFPSQINDYLNEAAKYYYDVTDNPDSLVILDDERTYLAIHHPWFNYYHWICESIFRLWRVQNKLKELVLVLPEYYKDHDFIMGSIEPFKIKNIFYIPNGKSLVVRNLCLPQIKPICDSYNAREVKQVRKFYTDYVSTEKHITSTLGDKLYISRMHATRRKVVNEQKIIDIVQKYGFTIFYPEKHTFLDQVAIFSQTKYLIGEHGSGITNMLFMPDGASLLELHKDKTNELDHPSPLFWYLADALNINYYHQLCTTEGREDYFEGSYVVDVRLLEKNIDLMLSA